MIDDLATFTASLPCWVGRDGFPVSYRHFRYGMDWINREDARRALRDASSARMGASDRKAYQAWRRDLLRGVD